MIQDIDPKVLDISYEDREFCEQDKVIVVVNEKVILKEGAEKSAFSFGELNDFGHELHDFRGNIEYFCKIDDEHYYVLNIEGSTDIEEHLENGFKVENPKDFRWLKPKYLGFACITALHLAYFRNKNKFCGNCGRKMSRRKDERAQVCESCGHMVYPTISPAIIVGIVDGDRLLLTSIPENKKFRIPALVSGYCELGESLEASIKREVMEEVGLKVKDVVYYGSQPWGFSRSLLMGFFARLDGGNKVSLNDGELSEANWVERQDIEPFDKGVAITSEMIKYFKAGGNPFKVLK